VYKLSKVGQAIDNNDLSTASSVLGGSTDTDWVKKANLAFTKVTLDYYITACSSLDKNFIIPHKSPIHENHKSCGRFSYLFNL
jgi:hypothetical protein